MTIDVPAHLLLEDGPLLAFDKPAGLATQAPAPFPSLERAVKEWLKERHAKPGNVYLGIPHRLDRPASGIVVFAKNSKAAARLAEQFQQRTVCKTYHAVVEGTLDDESCTLTDWLRKRPDEPRTDVVAEGTPGAKEAVLHFRRLAAFLLPDGRPATLVEVDLATGRMHQIRAQFAARGRPIVGDVAYGAASATPDDSIALHARRLVLRHPIRYDEATITAPTPPHWRALGVPEL